MTRTAAPIVAEAPPAGRFAGTESGMVLMGCAMLIVPGLDALAKWLSAWLSPGQIVLIRFAGQSLILGIFLGLRGAPRPPAGRLGALGLLGLFAAVAATLLIWSLSVMPLANVVAIFFVEPLILTLFSALFLSEAVGWRRILAVAVGLGGALIVIRPNWAAFGWVTLLPLAAAVFLAAYLTLTRHISARVSGLAITAWASLFATAILAVAVASGGALLGLAFLKPTLPPPGLWPPLLALGALAALVFLLIALAFGRAPASVLAPLQYLEIIGATALGYVIFGDFPDALTWLGTAVILASGLYVFHRERRLARQPPH